MSIRRLYQSLKKDHGLVLILILNAILTLNDLDFSIWTDEFASLSYSSESVQWIINNSLIINNQLPLYFVTLHYWLGIWGYENIVMARLISVIAGWVSLVYLFRLGDVLLDENLTQFKSEIILLTTFFLSVNPFFIEQQREIRVYSLFLMFSLMSSYYFVRYIQRSDTKPFLLFTIITFLLIQSHPFGVFYPPLQVLAAIFYYYFQNRSLKWLVDVKLMAGYAVIYLTLVPFILMADLGKTYYDRTRITIESAAPQFYSFLNYGEPILLHFLLIVLPGILLSLYSLFYYYNHDLQQLKVYISIWVIYILPYLEVSVYMLVFSSSIFSFKYFIYLFPLSLFLIVLTTIYIAKATYPIYEKYIKSSTETTNNSEFSLRNLNLKQYVRAMLILLLLINIVTMTHRIEYFQNPAKENWKEAAQVIHENQVKTDEIFIEEQFLNLTFRFYYDDYANTLNITGLSFPKIGFDGIIALVLDQLDEGRAWYIISHSRDSERLVFGYFSENNLIVEYRKMNGLELLLLND